MLLAKTTKKNLHRGFEYEGNKLKEDEKFRARFEDNINEK
jgi:hypothetical protein